jgi:hypothetical protein
MHVWITEFGKQTDPPDTYVGVPLATQTQQLRSTVALCRKNPRIDMLIWFLMRDEAVHSPRDAGFQSGLEFVTGRAKPAAAAFEQLAR